MLLTSAEQWGLLSQTSLREHSPRAEGHAGEEVTLGECCCFGFSESRKNVALSEQVKKKSMPPPTNDTISQAVEPQLVDK